MKTLLTSVCVVSKTPQNEVTTLGLIYRTNFGNCGQQTSCDFPLRHKKIIIRMIMRFCHRLIAFDNVNKIRLNLIPVKPIPFCIEKCLIHSFSIITHKNLISFFYCNYFQSIMLFLQNPWD